MNYNIIQEFIDNNKASELLFTKIFTEKNNIDLKYDPTIDTARTNGELILITPTFQNLYEREDLFNISIQNLKWTNIFKKHSINFNNITDRLYMISHALLIHECLHIIFTDFTLKLPNTIPESHKPIIHSISNIIEDAYIEKAGTIKFKSITYYLTLLRELISLLDNEKHENIKSKNTSSLPPLTRYLNYMIGKILYPKTKQEPPDKDILKAIKETTELFDKGILQKNGYERQNYSIKIYEKLIELGLKPEDYTPPTKIIISHESQNSNTQSKGLEYELDDTTTNTNTQQDKNEISENNNINHKDSENNNQDKKEALHNTEEKTNQELEKFAQNLKEDIIEAQKKEITEKASTKERNLIKYNDKLHHNITIIENILTPEKRNVEKYNSIKQKSTSIINKYKHKFSELLQAKTSIYDGKYIIGSKMSSKNFSNSKKKYWNKKTDEIEQTEITIQILVDGSGSMYGTKLQNAIKATIIIHEILEANNISHSIAEFRGYSNTQVEHNILLKFNHKANDKYNLIKLNAFNGNRDGLALLWAMKKLKNQKEENKIIIIISDGCPADYDYCGQVTIKDIKNIEKQCDKNKIKLIAIALEDGKNEIYENLKKYYKNILHCNKPETLPETLAKLITDLLKE